MHLLIKVQAIVLWTGYFILVNSGKFLIKYLSGSANSKITHKIANYYFLFEYLTTN